MKLYPCNDTKVDQQIPTVQTWYNDSILELAYDGRPASLEDMRGWFKFNLSSIYIGPINITSCTMYLYESVLLYGLGTGYYAIKSIDPTNETWTDTTITWNNAPTRNYYQEADPYGISGSGQWLSWTLYAGNSTQGIGALQDAYNNNRTKSYQIYCQTSPFYANFSSKENSVNKPYLQIGYNYTITTEPVTGRPTISSPWNYRFVFYPIQDVLINSASPTANYEGQTTGQVNYNSISGVTANILSKFNLTIPDSVFDERNNIGFAGNASFNMQTVPFIASSILFVDTCDFVFSPSGWNDIGGILRSNETWNSSTVTWNTAPSMRSSSISPALYINQPSTFSFDLTSEENYIRYSMQNNYTYTIVNRVNQTLSGQAYAQWVLSENPTESVPYILMDVQAPYVTYAPPSNLGLWTSMVSNFAGSLGLAGTDPGGQGFFIAGHMLTLFLYMVTVVPTAWLVKKKLYVILLSIGYLTFTLAIGWLNVGIYAVMLLLTALYMGGVFKR